ncbi:TIGR03899 family protein [Flavobacterium lutivivi]|nr:TIGR03899 family protein [Flavobacterium lutivivi]
MSLIKFEGKPIEKLIETVSAGIGVLYKPRAIRKEADAEAYRIEKLEEAKGKGMIIQAEVENEILERVKQRLVHQEVNRQINIDNVVEKSTLYLKDNVSEQPVDDDWRTRFFLKIQDITSADMQVIWAKILANEVSSPGGISIRTLEILNNMSKSEAEIFERAASLAFKGGHILKIGNSDAFDEFDVRYNDLLTLRAAGLLFESDNLSITVKHMEKEDCSFLNFGDKTVKIFKPNTEKYTFAQIGFTPAGTELIEALQIKPNYEYLDKFVDEGNKKGYNLEIIEFVDIQFEKN